MAELTIIGGGLAGAEAAWQAAWAGVRVRLVEMRPGKMTPAHHSGDLAELVCSNSLRAASLENAVGLLKEEMRRLGSLIVSEADKNAVPAGGTLAVDRQSFAKGVTEAVCSMDNVTRVESEAIEIPATGPVIIATGPLTSEKLAEDIARLTGQEYLYFHDAAAPIVTLESIDLDKVFRASRYGKGSADYLNCPMDSVQYKVFYDELITAEVYQARCETGEEKFFEGCMPIEVMAARGRETILYGPLKPVGLTDPRSNNRPYAVVQLRQDNAAATLYNLVGFQTRLRWPEQQRVFRLIPGLEKAEFVRFGVMHRNTYLNSPRILLPTLQYIKRADLFFAGQITGVEGYVESAAMGLLAGINATRLIKNTDPLIPPDETAHGSLCRYITSADPENFQPMNVNFGIFPPLPGRIAKKERKLAYAVRALEKLETWRKDWQN
ncbi:MAG: methylenetetrahydrofolate--tRNA-(uracil(54)-C(5))-methyltransferase (FADH(2)-oxidizing) TrmFO [Dethiobacter sp.]|nr:methylenetetrahydrofolate--tRNA-(uracil(54)-C(5))-methyltransferase (FADH(2)-oxidizing) TrmFO [Dethiobacter sp.]